MSANVESLRHKVEAGEALSEAELTALRAAAASSEGPTLWLAVAHALVNVDAEREALPLLERLRRDFPKDLQVRLGLARALLGLERHGDAEEVLREALVISPGDPEAVKVLAVLALRRGEKGRAQQYVKDVLERDPFDEEARLLKEELESVELPVHASAEEQVLRPEFNAALAAALGRAGLSFRLQGKDVLVKLSGGEVARVNVASLYSAYHGGKRGLTEYVEKLAAQIGGMRTELGEDATAVLRRVRPVLRSGGFETQAVGSLHRAGPAGLEVFYVLEDPEYVRYLPESALKAVGLTVEAVDSAAWSNLEASPAPVKPVVVDRGVVRVAETFSGLWAVAEGDGHDAARLLTAEQRRRLMLQAGEGALRVNLGWREFVLVCRESDTAECEALSKRGHAPDGIPGLFRLTAEGLARV